MSPGPALPSTLMYVEALKGVTRLVLEKHALGAVLLANGWRCFHDEPAFVSITGHVPRRQIPIKPLTSLTQARTSMLI